MTTPTLPAELVERAEAIACALFPSAYGSSEYAAALAAATAALSTPSLVAMREALTPFASIAERILSEAPPEGTEVTLFTDCQGCRHAVSLDGLRAARAALSPKDQAHD